MVVYEVHLDEVKYIHLLNEQFILAKKGSFSLVIS